MLDLNDQKAIDYSSEVPYFPRAAFGETLFTILSYEESGDANTEENKSDKEYDVATVRVERHEPAKLGEGTVQVPVKPGETYVLWFQTGGNGITMKNRAFKAAELRGFISAACGVQGDALRTFDAKKGRDDCLAEDFSAGDSKVLLVRRTDSPVPNKPGEFYCKDRYSVA
jgi:hypothetical protein